MQELIINSNTPLRILFLVRHDQRNMSAVRCQNLRKVATDLSQNNLGPGLIRHSFCSQMQKSQTFANRAHRPTSHKFSKPVTDKSSRWLLLAISLPSLPKLDFFGGSTHCQILILCMIRWLFEGDVLITMTCDCPLRITTR